MLAPTLSLRIFTYSPLPLFLYMHTRPLVVIISSLVFWQRCIATYRSLRSVTYSDYFLGIHSLYVYTLFLSSLYILSLCLVTPTPDLCPSSFLIVTYSLHHALPLRTILFRSSLWFSRLFSVHSNTLYTQDLTPIAPSERTAPTTVSSALMLSSDTCSGYRPESSEARVGLQYQKT